MAEDGKDDFESEYELNSHREHLSAYVLIAGLVLELINAVIWYKGSETLAEMAAVLLIVGGVWGEVFFANRARVAGDKQLAEYKARAAEAQLKLEQLRKAMAWRRLDKDAFLKAISNAQAKASVDFMYAENDPESFHFAVDIQILVREAGWSVSAPIPIPYNLKMGGLLLPTAPDVLVNGTGVSIAVDSLDEADKEGTAFKALEKALLENLGSVFGVRVGPEHLSSGKLLVIVAPRS